MVGKNHLNPFLPLGGTPEKGIVIMRASSVVDVVSVVGVVGGDV